uniref:Uncharacterized protein n=1 Tax=viral metagenome TaxID=1070528 RepID=A0A6C0CAK3_9ZZZZ
MAAQNDQFIHDNLVNTLEYVDPNDVLLEGLGPNKSPLAEELADKIIERLCRKTFREINQRRRGDDIIGRSIHPTDHRQA